MKFASHKKEDDPILWPSITVPILNFMTSFFAAFTLFAFIGYASLETGVAIEDMPIKGMTLAFVVYPTLLSTLPLAKLWSALFFIMLTSLGICTEYIFVECVSKMIYGFLKRKIRIKKSPTFVTFWLCLFILVINLVFFASSAGYYWLETVDHYATGVNLVVFLFIQLIVWVYMLPISDLAEKVYKHGERFPTLYMISFKYISPAFALFLAFTAIGNEFVFEPISEGIPSRVISYVIMITPMALFIGVAIWNPFSNELDKFGKSRNSLNKVRAFLLPPTILVWILSTYSCYIFNFNTL